MEHSACRLGDGIGCRSKLFCRWGGYPTLGMLENHLIFAQRFLNARLNGKIDTGKDAIF